MNAAGFRGKKEESRWSGMSTGGTLFAVSLGMSLKEEVTLQRLFELHVLKLSMFFWRRRRYVTRADLRKYGGAIGGAACSDIAVHGKTATSHT